MGKRSRVRTSIAKRISFAEILYYRVRYSIMQYFDKAVPMFVETDKEVECRTREFKAEAHAYGHLTSLDLRLKVEDIPWRGWTPCKLMWGYICRGIKHLQGTDTLITAEAIDHECYSVRREPFGGGLTREWYHSHFFFSQIKKCKTFHRNLFSIYSTGTVNLRINRAITAGSKAARLGGMGRTKPGQIPNRSNRITRPTRSSI